MKHVITHNWYWYADKAWRINAKGKGIRTDILRQLLKQLITMFEFHRKVFMLRFDLHVFSYTDTNKDITNFNRRLFKRIKQRYKTPRIGFVWVREQEKAKKQHYHYVLLLDGSKVQHPHTIQEWIREIWGDIDGAFHWAGYHNINRKDENSIQAACYHASYLAKARGKGYRPPQTKDLGSSRLKKQDVKRVKVYED